MADVDVVWTPRILLALDRAEAEEISDALGTLALHDKLSDNALTAWQRLSSAVIDLNSRHIDGE